MESSSKFAIRPSPVSTGDPSTPRKGTIMAHVTLHRGTNQGPDGPRKSHKARNIAIAVSAVAVAIVLAGAIALQVLGQQANVIDQYRQQNGGTGTQASQPALTTAPSAVQPQPTTAPSANQPTTAPSGSLDANGVPKNLSERLAIFDRNAIRKGLTADARNGDIATAFVANWYRVPDDFTALLGLTEDYAGSSTSVSVILHQPLDEAYPSNVQDVSSTSGTERTITMQVSFKNSPSVERTPITVHIVYQDDHWLAKSVQTPDALYKG
jgi:hypothetical protein